MKLKDILPPFFIGIIASILIFFKFNQIPSQLAFDEIEFTKIALSLDHNAYTPYVSTAYGHSTLYFYIILASFKLFGVSSFALRLPSAVFGIASVLLFYFILKKTAKNPNIALFGALVLATQRWFYTFARYSFEATFLTMLELTSLLFIVSFLHSKRNTRTLVLAALFSGMAFLSYQPGRIFFLLPLLFLFSTRRFREIGVFLATFLVVISPLVLYFTNHVDYRVHQLSILNDRSLNPIQKGEQIGENLKRNVLQLYINQGDINGRHNYPGKVALNPIIALLMTVGLYAAYLKRRDLNNQFFFIYAVLSIAPSLLVHSVENPNMLRVFTLLIPISYFAAIGALYLFTKMRVKKTSMYLGISVLLLIAAVYDARTYFTFQKAVFKQSFEVTCPLPKVLMFHPNNLAEIPIYCRNRSSNEKVTIPQWQKFLK